MFGIAKLSAAIDSSPTLRETDPDVSDAFKPIVDKITEEQMDLLAMGLNFGIAPRKLSILRRRRLCVKGWRNVETVNQWKKLQQ